MTKNPIMFLEHILDSINAIKSFVDKMSKEELQKDRLKQGAVVRELEVIGEAVKNLPESIRKEHKNIPWKQIAGMRDKLIHHYFGVDIDIVWDTIAKDLKPLEIVIKEIIKKG